jgi:hypothetical protein
MTTLISNTVGMNSIFSLLVCWCAVGGILVAKQESIDCLRGPRGHRGLNGRIGAVGPQGPPGKDGVQGEIGPQGPPGINGTDGAQGPIGPSGPEGLPGANGNTGPTGPPWIKSSAFAVYISESNDNLVLVPNQPLEFNHQILHRFGATGSRLTVQNTGYYLISATLNNIYNISFILGYIWKNGIPINGTYYANNPGTPYGVFGSIVIPAADGDYFELVTSASFMEGGVDVVAYSMTITQIG